MKYKFLHSPLFMSMAVLLCSFMLTIHIANNFISSRIEEEKQLVRHTAQTTFLHIESKIEKYIAATDTVKQYLVYNGEEKTYAEFDRLSQSLLDSNGIIQCVELAKGGVVNKAYPLLKNEHAIGLNLLGADKRRHEATLARNTGKYTLAGPFPLVQGGVGVLLFDPVYIHQQPGGVEFWGYSLVVIDWNGFVREANLAHLEESGYRYSLWHNDPYTGEKAVITGSKQPVSEQAITIECPMPNDIWYMDIEVKDGWIDKSVRDMYLLLAIIIPLMLAIGCWQYSTGQIREAKHKKQLENALTKAEVANEAKTRFLFNMSHDIRTPMNAILGFTEIAKGSNDPKQIKDSLNKIELAGQLLLKLINEILNISRIESGSMQPTYQSTNLYSFGQELETLFINSMAVKELDYKVVYELVDADVECDAQHLQEICVNLIANAQKFTPAHGKIIVSIKELERQGENGVYEFRITDTGIGMSKEFQKVQYQLFERERSNTVAHTEGTGLGLSIVKRLTDLLDGSIDCYSEPDRGTVYTLKFTFKVLPKPVLQKKEEKPLCNEDLVCKEVLVVEDNELNREIAVVVLSKAGMLVSTANDGSEAVNMARQKRYDLILMDIQMPVMNGYEATRAIRKLPDSNLASVPIIAMTANAFDEDRQKAFGVGMDGHVAKPIDIPVLLKAIEEALQKKQQEKK